MNKTLSTIVAAATLLVASHASAATIDFTNAGTFTGGATGLAGISYTTSATYGLTSNFAAGSAGTVGGNHTGLGVSGDVVGSANRIDGLGKGTWETLTVTFVGGAVNLVNFILGKMDTNDDFEYSFNGSAFTSMAAPTVGDISGSNDNVTYSTLWANVTTFSIRASGDDNDGDNGNVPGAGDDDFSLFAANVSAVTTVPLPAGAPLLLAGLAGLAALRRRKRA